MCDNMENTGLPPFTMTLFTIFRVYDESFLGTTPPFTIAKAHTYDGIIFNLLSHFKSRRQTLSQSCLA